MQRGKLLSPLPHHSMGTDPGGWPTGCPPVPRVLPGPCPPAGPVGGPSPTSPVPNCLVSSDLLRLSIPTTLDPCHLLGWLPPLEYSVETFFPCALTLLVFPTLSPGCSHHTCFKNRIAVTLLPSLPCPFLSFPPLAPTAGWRAKPQTWNNPAPSFFCGGPRASREQLSHSRSDFKPGCQLGPQSPLDGPLCPSLPLTIADPPTKLPPSPPRLPGRSSAFILLPPALWTRLPRAGFASSIRNVPFLLLCLRLQEALSKPPSWRLGWRPCL